MLPVAPKGRHPMERLRVAGLCTLALAASQGASSFLCGSPSPLAAGRAVSVRRHAAMPKSKSASPYKSNEEIRAMEVRLVGEMNADTNEIEDMNEVLATSDAQRRAQSKGLDLVMINEDKDPPLVKIVKMGKYVYEEKKQAKQRAQSAKTPKMKEVKLSYTVGEHDLQTKLSQMEGWLGQPRQQVKVVIQMKGRTKMFEKQARELITRVQEEVAAFGKVAGNADKATEAWKKDNRGDLVMLLNSGPDVKLLKQIAARNLEAAEAAEDEEEEEEVEEKGKGKKAKDVPPEIAELMEEIEETKQDLLDCGIKPGQVASQPEMQDLYKELDEAKRRLGYNDKATASSAFGRRSVSGPATSSALACGELALAAGALVATAWRRRALRARRWSSI